MRDKSKVVRIALRAAKRRRYDIGGIADPYGMMETEEELRKKNPLYQNTGDLGFLNPQLYDPAKDLTTLGPNTNAGQLGTGLPNGLGGVLTPTDPKGNDLVPYDNANYQPGAVQTFDLPTNDFVAYNNANYNPGAVQSFSLAPPSSPALTSTPAQVAALNVATNPNQMFTDSGKITSQAGQQLPGFLGAERSAFVDQSKAAMAAYGNFADTLAASQSPTPTATEVNQELPGAVAGANLAGTFDPIASPDVLGDVSHGAFGLSGPMGLSNAMQETNEQVDAQEAQQEAEQAAAAEAENAGGGDGDAPEGGGGVPEGGGGPDEKRGGRIHMRQKYAVKRIPVHNSRNEARGGSIVDQALMLTSRRLSAAKAPK